MNKKISRILTAGLAAVMLACAALPVSAAGTNYSGMATDSLTSTTLDKYLVMDEGANVPNVEFAYSIAKGSAMTYDTEEGVFQVLEGKFSVDGKKPSIAWDQYAVNELDADDKSTVKFTSSDSTILFASKGTTDYVKGLEAGEKYAKHTATIDFTGVVFPEPGVYRYIITEDTETTLAGINYDTDATRVLDVYVVDASTDSTKELKIQSFVLHANVSGIPMDTDGNMGSNGIGEGTTSTEGDGTEASDYKSQGFTNEFVSHDLVFSKTVDGNQASRDKYFKFTVTISGALKNSVYTVSIQDDSNDNTTDGDADATVPSNAATLATYVGQTNPLTITTDASGNATAVFYLQHGQSIAIRGLGDGTKYTIEETPEDYLPAATPSGDADVAVDGDNAAKVVDTTSGIKADTTVAYKNTRGGVIPTGVLLVVAPFAGLMLVGGVGTAVVLGKKRKNEDAE